MAGVLVMVGFRGGEALPLNTFSKLKKYSSELPIDHQM